MAEERENGSSPSRCGTLLFLLLCSIPLSDSEACGGNFTEVSGTITSPSYPNAYSHNLTCVYLISRPQGHRITLTFTDFQLEGKHLHHCHDYVQVQDGGSENSSTLSTIFCGSETPPPQRTTQNLMRITFFSNSFHSSIGFSANYTSAVLSERSLLVTEPRVLGGAVIYRIDMDVHSYVRIPTGSISLPLAFDFDPVDGRIYWSDFATDTINSALLDGSNSSIVFFTGRESPCQSVAVDFLSRLIFYAKSETIGLLTIPRFLAKVIIDDTDDPRSVVLNMMDGVIYWGDVGDTPKIEKANYDGSDRKAVVTNFAGRPIALALDVEGDSLYWIDSNFESDRIQRSDLDGRFRTTIFTAQSHGAFGGLDFYEDKLFTTDTQMHNCFGTYGLMSTLYVINATTGAGLENWTSPGFFNTIRIHDQSKSLKGYSGCGNDNGGCSYICIPKPGNSSTCLCPDDVFCDANGSSTATCGGNFTEEYGIITSPNFPKTYVHNQMCVYLISGPRGHRITLNFTAFNLEEGIHGICYDYVKVQDGASEYSPIIGEPEFCGSVLPGVQQTTQNVMRVTFFTDSSTVKSGFRALYTTDLLPDWCLLLASTNGIYRLFLGSSSVIRPQPLNSIVLQATAVDPLKERIYWADFTVGAICSAFFNGTNNVTHYIFNPGLVSGCSGLAVDYLSGLIFCTDSINDIIGIVPLTSSIVRTVLSSELDNPRDITLDMMNGVMYWTEVGSSPKIARASYDGGNYTAVISAVRNPSTLALDLRRGYLYWADADTGKIERSNLDGNQRTVIYSLPGSRFRALALHDNSLYVIDATAISSRFRLDLFKVDATTGALTGNWSISFFSIQNIITFDPKTAIRGANGCSNNNGGCPYICVPKPGNLSACLSPDDGNKTACGGNYTSPSGIIQSPRYPRNYPSFLDCIYYIRQPEGNRITINVMNFSVEYTVGCYADFLEIRDGASSESPLLGTRYCNTRMPPSVLWTTRNEARIRFKTDVSVSSQGFLIKFEAAPVDVGRVTINGPQVIDTDGSQNMTLNCQSDDPMSVSGYTWSVTCVTQAESTCLFLPAVPEDDGKLVRCTVHYKNGKSAYGNFTVDLNYPPKSRPIINGYKAGDILTEGENLNLSCSVLGGKPAVTSVFLACGGYADNPVDISSAEGKKSSLEISPVQASDNGAMCVCTARWKNTDWYNQTAAFVLRVKGHISDLQSSSTPQHAEVSSTLKASAIGWTVGGVILLVVTAVILIIIIKRRRGRRNENVSLVADVTHSYSNLKKSLSESDARDPSLSASDAASYS